jgi:hypothetical protein
LALLTETAFRPRLTIVIIVAAAAAAAVAARDRCEQCDTKQRTTTLRTTKRPYLKLKQPHPETKLSWATDPVNAR